MKTSGENINEVMKDIINEEKEVDFEILDPMPKELEGTTSPVKEENKELKEKYGADNWFDWRWMNWGCKWNACRTEQREDGIIEFDTPWNPPVGWLFKLSKKYPKVKFKVQFADEFEGQQPLGEITLLEGKIVKEKTVKEGTMAAGKAASDIWSGVWTKHLK